MLYSNVFLPVQDLKKAPVKPGGLCSLVLFKWEDVAIWPDVNPLTGIIDNAIVLKPGGIMYLCQAVEKGRTFIEDQKESAAGPYMEITFTGTLAGNTSNNTLSVATMMHHRFGIILYDRDGNTRLVGNKDSGAKFSHRYTPEDITGSRKRELKLVWQHSLPAPLYNAQAFPLNIGGVTVMAGSLKLLMHFQVGAAGSPMVNGQTDLVNAAFANKKLLILVDGVALPCDDGSGNINWADPRNAIRRRYEKLLASNTVNFLGGTVDGEIIEIYEIS